MERVNKKKQKGKKIGFQCDSYKKNHIFAAETNQNTGMKRIVLLMIMVLGMTVSVDAQTISNADNNIVAQVEKDGTLLDKDNNLIARFEEDGTIYDSNSNAKGKIEKDGSVYDHNNNYQGKVASDGSAYNFESNYLGKIWYDGSVRDSESKTIGYAKDVNQNIAAVYFFFQFLIISK